MSVYTFIFYGIFVEPTCVKGSHSCYYFAKVYVRAYVGPDLSGPQLLHLWIDFKIDTVIVLEEEKCHLNIF